jgi:7-cyano-7-deazaguanine synthase
MFLSILLSYSEALKADKVWYGAAEADSLAGYWDGSIQFVDKLNQICLLNREVDVRVEAPLLKMSKKEIILNGVELGVNFGDTYTCYSGEYPCDAESASSALRLKGFVDAGFRDPLVYKQQDKLNKVYEDNNCKNIILD